MMSGRKNPFVRHRGGGGTTRIARKFRCLFGQGVACWLRLRKRESVPENGEPATWLERAERHWANQQDLSGWRCQRGKMGNRETLETTNPRGRASGVVK